MKTLQKISEIVICTMKEGDDAKNSEDGFILDGAIIRKPKAEDSDPLFIDVLRQDGQIEKFVRLGADKIESNEEESARVWEKV